MKQNENILWENFFKNLGKKFSTENDLSDIIYCSLRSFPSVIDFWNKLLKGRFAISPETSFDREISYAFGRVDIQFINPKKSILMFENKLWDKDDHFEQYQSFIDTHPDYDVTMLYVAIEEPRRKQEMYNAKWIVLTWANIANEMSRSDDIILKSLASYIREVAMTPEIKEIRLDEPHTYCYLFRNCQKILEGKRLFGLISQWNHYTRSGEPIDEGFGPRFELTLPNGLTLSGLWGLNMNGQKEEFTLRVLIPGDAWSNNKNIISEIGGLLKNGGESSKGDFCFDGTNITFDMKRELHDEFNKLDILGQNKYLEDLWKECIGQIEMLQFGGMRLNDYTELLSTSLFTEPDNYLGIFLNWGIHDAFLESFQANHSRLGLALRHRDSSYEDLSIFWGFRFNAITQKPSVYSFIETNPKKSSIIRKSLLGVLNTENQTGLLPTSMKPENDNSSWQICYRKEYIDSMTIRNEKKDLSILSKEERIVALNEWFSECKNTYIKIFSLVNISM